ncbi:hypothetical protein [Streptomyces sp. bgisy034]|uniref:hypothetical protein n=1 Tax=Streptomyces sp. bgisy034 TaxID=3413774 RepID=UPI003EBC177B
MTLNFEADQPVVGLKRQQALIKAVFGASSDITGWRPEEIDDGTALSTELGQFPGGRSLYDPLPGEPRTPGPGLSCRFYYSGDTP